MNNNQETVSIVLVEDNQMDIDLTLLAFERVNYSKPVQIARDGAEILGMIDQWNAGKPMPQLILLDINLPKVSGLEVLKVLKKSSRTNHIPVVMLTSSSNDSDIRTAYDCGANSYLIKPIDFDKFKTLTNILIDYWISLNIKPEGNR